eukprot:g8017.t1
MPSKAHKRIRVSSLTCICILLFVVLLTTGNCSKLPELPTNIDDAHIGTEKGILHVVSASQCNGGYFTFQSWAQKYSLEMVNQPGRFTRIISCNKPEELSKEDLSYMDTMVVPDWGIHPKTGDDYTPYNRPVALIYWLAERKPTAEWTLILDPDMLLRQPVLLKDFEVPEGYAIAAYYDFLKGVHNQMTEVHIPEVIARQDNYGGPKGRKADMAGAFYLIRTKDLVKVAPLWLKYTEDIRADPLTITYTGTEKQKPPEKEWVSEMYGYCFAAAKVGVWHKLESATMYYPNYNPQDFPVVIHYGLNHTITDNYYFDKHTHMSFNSMKCPPWNMDFHRHYTEDGGLFPHPPFPDVIPDLSPREKYGKLLAIDVVNTLNEALCTRHRKMCPASVQLEKECGQVAAIAAALKVEFDKLHVPGVICHDDNKDCEQWAKNGQCEATWGYMIKFCRKSCNWCRTYIPRRNEIEISNNRIQNKKTEVLRHPEDDSAEIQRCEKLNIRSFLDDLKCQKLVKEGFISFDRSRFSKLNSDRRIISQVYRGGSGSDYIVFLCAVVVFIGVLVLARKYFSSDRSKASFKYQ